jgi:hypothetical protein
MYPYGLGPIYEPKDSRYRPNSVSTLISFLIFRLIGRAFRWILNGFRRQPKQ